MQDPTKPLADLKAGVYDAEDIMEMVQDQEVSASFIEYNQYLEDETTEKPGVTPWMERSNS